MDEPFINEQLEMEDLPRLEDLQYSPLHKDYLGVRLLGWGILFLVLGIIAAIVYFSTPIELWQISTIWGVLAIFSLILEILGFRKKGFAIRERDITYRSGIIFHRITTVPLTRVQHSEVIQGPLARMFDLASVRIYTAGGSNSDLSIPGIKEKEANRIREFLNEAALEETRDA